LTPAIKSSLSFILPRTTVTTPILYEKRGAIARITLNRPEARNSLTPEMLCRLADAFRDFADDNDLRVAIVTGAGDKAFCAGGDLARTLPLLAGAREPKDDWDRRVLNDPLVMPASGLRDFPLWKPVIAAINGPCLAAGTELVLGTDIRIAAEHATLGLPEVTRALVPFAGSMARLPRQIPYAVAMELMLTGEPISAQDAYRIGLVNRIVPASEVAATAEAIAHKIAANGPLAVQRVKETVLRSSGMPLTDAYRIEDESRRIVFASEDAKEGPRAFMEKRSAKYIGK
jgi:enoyl-CoA hydratase